MGFDGVGRGTVMIQSPQTTQKYIEMVKCYRLLELPVFLWESERTADAAEMRMGEVVDVTGRC